MHAGMIAGNGPAANNDHDLYPIHVAELADRDLQLTMARANTKTLLKIQVEGNYQAQVDIFQGLENRLEQCGAEPLAIRSIAGPLCIQQFKPVSAVRVIDLVEAVQCGACSSAARDRSNSRRHPHTCPRGVPTHARA